MKNLAGLFFTAFFSILFFTARAQEIDKPNFAFASHPISIEKIIRLPDAFVIRLNIENQMENGYFCASKTIYLQDIISGKKIKLNHAENIPVCPDVYHFKWVGEKLHFSLYFPLPDSGLRYANVIEECQSHCLSIYGLITDAKMNNQINRGFDAYSHQNLSFALESFEAAVQQNPDYPFGFLYAHIIKILLEQEKYDEAKSWFQKLKMSNFIDKKSVLKQIEKLDNAWKLK